MSYDCQQPFDTCRKCAGHHCTTACNNQDRPRCVSCKAEGHTSWSHRCPVFLSKCHEMDARMTKNQMLYYPTTDPWTHMAHCDYRNSPPLHPGPRNPSTNHRPSRGLQVQIRRQLEPNVRSMIQVEHIKLPACTGSPSARQQTRCHVPTRPPPPI